MRGTVDPGVFRANLNTLGEARDVLKRGPMRARIMTVTAALTMASSSAWALDQSEHQEMTRTACSSAGLPSRFCARVASEAYNVDHYEWDLMAAHGQPEPGQSLCDAANATAGRVFELADGLAHWLQQPPTGERTVGLAAQLGRVLHTVQDNCAHAGISNAHHAWLSLEDTCEGTNASPDHQPEAEACALEATDAILKAFVAQLAQAGGSAAIDNVEATTTRYPSRDGVCEFLQGAHDWDGIDRRWNNGWVTTSLQEHFVAGITGGRTLRPACSGAGSELFRAPGAPVDVSAGPTSCTRIEAFCVGKSDLGDEAPPWDDGTHADAMDSTGCSATGNGRASSLLLVLPLLAYGLRRRQRR